MKILQICFRPILPTNDGGAIAMYNMSVGFEQHPEVDLSLFVLNTHKHQIDDSKIIDAIGNSNVTSSFLDTRINPLKAFFSLFKSSSYNIDRFDDEKTKKRLIKVLKNNTFDIIHFEGLYVSPYLETVRKYNPSAITVLRSHNIEHLIWTRRANQNKGIKNLILNNLANKLARYESKSSILFDAIVPITEIDKPYYQKLNINNIFVSSTGFTIQNEDKCDYTHSNAIFHLGSLDWAPNLEAIEWFISKSWLKLKKQNPKLKFYIAGKNMPQSFMENKSEGIEILGEIDDAHDFIRKHGVMIVPLLSGSGMRIKIIEGMALGCPIVSTSIGAEGIKCTNNQNIVIANTIENFTEELDKIIKDQNKREFIGLNAIKNIEENYSNQSLVNELVKFYQSLIN